MRYIKSSLDGGLANATLAWWRGLATGRMLLGRRPGFQLLAGLLALGFVLGATAREPSRNMDFNSGWRFSSAAPGDAQPGALDDTDWRVVKLPHDWSVEASFDKNLEGATGYLPGGIGWYRKHFVTAAGSGDKVTYLLFDGVYNNATVWINSTKLGFHPYGYSPFHYNLTAHLKPDGQENVVTVKVDRSRYADSRWYPGSGIYRNVSLVTVDKLHVPVWGTYVTTPEVTREAASVVMEVRVKNDSHWNRTFALVTELRQPSGRVVARHVGNVSVPAKAKKVFIQRFQVKSPALWDTEEPKLYTAATRIVKNGTPTDEYETRFGIRTLRYDSDEGFFLNGRNTPIKGVCLHHDGGLVGAAVPKGVWQRRLAILKDGGCNAIRISHNPGSEEFLDLCDEMGFLVQTEFFDEWDYPKDKRLNMGEKSVDYITRGYGEHFQEWAERDLKNTMLRNRNHPCVIMWSIGNEIEWTYEQSRPATGYFDMDWKGNYFWTPPRFSPEEIRRRYEAQPKTEYMIGPTARKLAAWTRELDTTRPVVANLILPSVSHVSGYWDALDIVGYSYRRVVYDYGHEHFPQKMIMGTENLPQWHEWKAVIERPFIPGTFLWTGIDYLGESNGKWPVNTTASGLLDRAGFKKPPWHLYRTLWNDDAHVFLATQTEAKSRFKVSDGGEAVVEKKPGSWEQLTWFWSPLNEHWNYTPSEAVIVEAISNCDSLDLFLNGRSLGTKRLEDFEDRIYKWAVPFEPGTLVVKGRYQGRRAQASLTTSEAPAAIKLTADRKTAAADGEGVVHVVAQLVDANGHPVRTEDRTLTLSIEGNATLLGVDTGSPDNVQAFQSNQIRTDKGRCLAVVQVGSVPGRVEISAQSDGLESKPVRVRTRKPRP